MTPETHHVVTTVESRRTWLLGSRREYPGRRRATGTRDRLCRRSRHLLIAAVAMGVTIAGPQVQQVSRPQRATATPSSRSSTGWFPAVCVSHRPAAIGRRTKEEHEHPATTGDRARSGHPSLLRQRRRRGGRGPGQDLRRLPSCRGPRPPGAPRRGFRAPRAERRGRRRWFRAIDDYLAEAGRHEVPRTPQHLGYLPPEEALLGLHARDWIASSADPTTAAPRPSPAPASPPAFAPRPAPGSTTKGQNR
ncbi:hypothetical protein B0H03_103139 [Rathayibacter iranicus NCPPB 2253 = VKM Ac-1602]|uniref:Uncharacterized protein n=1 Tax=Rathayibacter iranicus NCPPB 2253 = VKM Ac-1602 TaxID=1328868 RepID=A0ABX5LHH3_9MICO|nr:hypothetical protein B0H03_103139 [Rathayibacter iranicus NCPPB 2253 = VKM Ac-1602]